MTEISDRPMILHTRVVSGTGGGPDKTILNSPRLLESFGYGCVCAYMHPPGDPGFDALLAKAEELGARLVGVPDRGPFDLSVVRRMIALCREHDVAIWHGHDYKSNALGLLVRRFHPMRLVTTVHGWGVRGGRRAFYYKIDRLCLRRYERVVCVSESLREVCVASRVSADRCVVIENAIDTEQFRRRTSRVEAKRREGFDPDRLLVGSVGRLSGEKDFDGLIRAVGRMVESGRAVDLVLVGEGDQREQLERLIAELEMNDHVRLTGFRDDTIGLYEAMDVFVLNSRREGLPNVVLEAMALEVPVLSTRVAGVPRLIDHGKSGLLIDPEDTDGLTTTLGRMLDDDALRASLAQAARRVIDTRYGFSLRMEKMRALYADVLS